MYATPESLFETDTPLGFRDRVDRTRWELIVGEKHPAMDGRELDVKSHRIPNGCNKEGTKSDGYGVHWPDVDEDLSVEGMLHGVPARRPKK